MGTGVSISGLGDLDDVFEVAQSSSESFVYYGGYTSYSSALLGNDVQLLRRYCHASAGQALGRSVGIRVNYKRTSWLSGDIGYLLAKKGSVSRAAWTSSGTAAYSYLVSRSGSKSWSINLNNHVSGGSVNYYQVHSASGSGSSSLSGSTLTCSLSVASRGIASRSVYIKFNYGNNRTSATKLFSFLLESDGEPGNGNL